MNLIAQAVPHWGSIGEAGDIVIAALAGLVGLAVGCSAAHRERVARRRRVRQAWHWRHWWWM